MKYGWKHASHEMGVNGHTDYSRMDNTVDWDCVKLPSRKVQFGYMLQQYVQKSKIDMLLQQIA